MRVFLKSKIIYIYLLLYFIVFLLSSFLVFFFYDNLLKYLIINVILIWWLVFVYYKYINYQKDMIIVNKDKILYLWKEYYLKNIEEIQLIQSSFLYDIFKTKNIKIIFKTKDFIISKFVFMPFDVAKFLKEEIKK